MARWWAALVALAAGAVLFVTSLPLPWDYSTTTGGGSAPLDITFTGEREYLWPPVPLGHLVPAVLWPVVRGVLCVLLPLGLGVASLLLRGAGQAAARLAAAALAGVQLGTVVPLLLRLYQPGGDTTSGGDTYTFTDRPGPGVWLALAGLVLLAAAALLAPPGGRPTARRPSPRAARRSAGQRRLVAVGVAGCAVLAVALAVPWFGSVENVSDRRFVPVTAWSGVFAVGPWLPVAPHRAPAVAWFASLAFVLALLGAVAGVPAAVAARSALAAPLSRILCGLAALAGLGALAVAYLLGHYRAGAGTVRLLEVVAANPEHREVAALALGPYLALVGLLLVLVFAAVPTRGLALTEPSSQESREAVAR